MTVAFTDYQPFDLDEIEPEPIKTKWANFVRGIRGIARYNLFDGKVKFRIGGRVQFDGSAGNGNEKFEEFYLPIESDFNVRRFKLYAAGRIQKFNFNLAFELGPDWGLSDAWIEGSEGGLEVWGKYIGKLRVGFMNEPFSLERQTSSYQTRVLGTIIAGADLLARDPTSERWCTTPAQWTLYVGGRLVLLRPPTKPTPAHRRSR